MELRTYWKILVRRWWLVIVPVVVAALYVAATYTPPGPVHQVVMRFAAGTKPAGLSEDYDRYYPWLTSEYIANGLADVAETEAFARAVASRLAEAGLEIPPGAIQSAVVTDNAQSILVIYLTWPDAEQIVAVAEAITAELTTNGAAYYPQLEGIEPAVRRLDTPAPVPLPPGLRAQLAGPVVKIGLVAALGAALALLWHYLDPTVREAAELEELGLVVLAEIPRHHSMNNESINNEQQEEEEDGR
jgi:capsular polysaccharide biosynthesis protein